MVYVFQFRAEVIECIACLVAVMALRLRWHPHASSTEAVTVSEPSEQRQSRSDWIEAQLPNYVLIVCRIPQNYPHVSL